MISVNEWQASLWTSVLVHQTIIIPKLMLVIVMNTATHSVMRHLWAIHIVAMLTKWRHLGILVQCLLPELGSKCSKSSSLRSSYHFVPVGIETSGVLVLKLLVSSMIWEHALRLGTRLWEHALRLYLLPKLHKVAVPGTPIVTSNGCPMKNISRFFDHYLPFYPAFLSYLFLFLCMGCSSLKRYNIVKYNRTHAHLKEQARDLL